MNGTIAKEIALYFLKAIGMKRYTPAIVSKTIVQAKAMLKSGYTPDEIISCIDYVVNSGKKIHSLGYINASINDILAQVKLESLKEQAKTVKHQLEEELERRRKEVIRDDESRTRNQQKTERFGVQSRLGKKFNFDMFEEQ